MTREAMVRCHVCGTDHLQSTSSLYGSRSYGWVWHCPQHADCRDEPRGSGSTGYVGPQVIEIEDVKRASARGDRHWFDPGTLRWFGSRVAGYAYRSGSRAYFVSSERDRSYPYGAWGNQRRYSVRVCDMDTGRIETVGVFGQYRSRSGAQRAALRLAS